MRIPYESCPLCGGHDFTFERAGDCGLHPLYVPGLPSEIRWLRCDACDHVHTDSHWSDEALAKIHNRTIRKVGDGLEGQRHIAAAIVEKVARYHEPAGPWIDIGPGNGSLLFAAAEWGYAPLALDVRRDVVDALWERGIDGLYADGGVWPEKIGVSVVSMADVLEHMADPVQALRDAHRALRNTGVLFVSLPNMDTELWREMDRQDANPYWNEIEHYHNFTRNRLHELLRETGFEPVHYDVSRRYRCGMEVIACAR